MNTYAILRRNGWQTPEALEAAAMRSKQVGDEQMPDEVSWIRSYVLVEEDGTLGTVCIYQATEPGGDPPPRRRGRPARRRDRPRRRHRHRPPRSRSRDRLSAARTNGGFEHVHDQPAGSRRATRTRRCGRRATSPASRRPCGRAARRSSARSGSPRGSTSSTSAAATARPPCPRRELGADVLGVDIAANLVAAGNARAQSLGLDELQVPGGRRIRPRGTRRRRASTSSSASSARCSRRSRSTSPRRWSA